MTNGSGSDRPEKMFLGVPVWGWLAGAFAIALVLGFVFYSNSAKLAAGHRGTSSILDTVAPSSAPANASKTP